MKKELTIEHRCAYAPYGVRMIGPNIMPPHEDIIGIPPPSSVLITDRKMILRPLSDLTKEITHNGETFVPNNRYPLKYFVEADLNDFIDNISTAYYHQIQYLHSLHFDTFGLIDAGLAIDINTINI